MKAIKTILFVATLFTTTVHADPVTVPNTFTPGTPAKASEVNANFTALANAVNAVYKPLGLYDSTGKRIGDFQLESATSGNVLITSLPGYGLTNPIWVYASRDGFFPRWNGNGNGNAFNQTLYYTTSDCSGEVYTFPSGERKAGWAVSMLPASSTSGLIPTNDPLTIHANSQRDVERHWDGSPPIYLTCYSDSLYIPDGHWYPYDVSNVVSLSQAIVVDLSVFVPPFSIH